MSMRSSVRYRIGLLMTLVILDGCTQPIGPDYHLPNAVVAASPGAGKAFEQMQGHAELYHAAAPPMQWWRLYQDERMNRLIGLALQRNASVHEALANLQRVQAVEDEVAGQHRPATTLSGGPSYGHASGLSRLQPGTVPANAWSYSAGAAVSYQLDLFGQLRRAEEAAAADTEAAAAAMDLVRVTVVAATVQSYADLCAAGLELNAARDSLAIQQDARRATEQLQRAGHSGVVDTIRAQAQERQIAAAIPPLQAQRQAALYQLAVLIGGSPAAVAADVSTCQQPPRIAAAIPVGDGVQLLRRRPDIRQAERALAASTARIGVAMSDLYPKVSLGVSGTSAGPANGLGHSDTYSWSVGPLITWSVPDNGIAKARISQAEATARAALARFDAVVLESLRETETALNAFAMELQHQAELCAARDAHASVARQLRLLYRSGKTNYLDALDAERALAASESALARSSAQLSHDQIALFLALGGGWSDETDEAR